jgi:integrase
MSLFKRGDTYWIDIRHKNKRVRRSAGTLDSLKAQEFHDQVKADLWRVEKLGDKPRRTWKEAVIRWLRENQHKKSLGCDKRRLKLLHVWLGELYLDEVNRDMVDQIKYERAGQNKLNSQGTDTGQLITSAEVNRMLALLRTILNAACHDWEWVDRIPKVKLFKEAKKRIRWISHTEAATLLKHLPEHLRAIARFSLATGLREQNVLGLEWSQIDLSRRVAWIHGDMTKNSQALAVPLNDEALFVIREQRFKNELYVFTYKGERIARANNTGWRNALKSAGIEDFRWHDLRHTWASWHVQNGTALNVLQELGGWESIEMVRRYAHLAPENLAAAAANNLPRGHVLVTEALEDKNKAKV